MALDAAARGLSVALVEQADFASGTSSRSTKLVHGGVRYLEKAVFGLDYSQLKLVYEALHERKTLLRNAPHLCGVLPIMTPCYSWWEVPYYLAGMKLYDLVAGSGGLAGSHFVSAATSRRGFPTLSDADSQGRSLKGTVMYYDGQFNDSRLCVALVGSAAEHGATVSNYCRVEGLIRDKDGAVTGARVRDVLRGEGRVFEVHARVVVNATGPFSDHVRQMADPGAAPIVQPSAGVHITLPDYYSPIGTGLIVPKTKDGRVVFMLPWLGHTIAGTTDSSAELTLRPRPTEDEISFILDALREFLAVNVRREDVLSAWSGLRPLASDPQAKDTASISRDHVIAVEAGGLVTVVGGKWTTYRRMAEEAVNAALGLGRVGDGVTPHPCRTERLPLVGAPGFSERLFTQVAQNYVVPHRPGAIDTRVAKHLAQSYGVRAFEVTRIAEEQALGQRLARGFPELEAEVVYAVRHEFCCTVEDFLARRTRLAFKDTKAARDALPRVVALMGRELRWGWWQRRRQLARGTKMLEEFSSGKGDVKKSVSTREENAK